MALVPGGGGGGATGKPSVYPETLDPEILKNVKINIKQFSAFNLLIYFIYKLS